MKCRPVVGAEAVLRSAEGPHRAAPLKSGPALPNALRATAGGTAAAPQIDGAISAMLPTADGTTGIAPPMTSGRWPDTDSAARRQPARCDALEEQSAAARGVEPTATTSMSNRRHRRHCKDSVDTVRRRGGSGGVVGWKVNEAAGELWTTAVTTRVIEG